MNQLEAIKYLAEKGNYGNEWQGAGLWEAVTTILATESALLNKEYLDVLINHAVER